MRELYEVLEMDYSKASVRELNEAIVRLGKANRKEYETRGNTERCQVLFRRREEAKAELDRRLL